MKKFGILYFIIVILFSIIPCSDALEAHVDGKVSIERVSQEKSDCNTEKCASSCLCICCGQSMVVQDYSSFEIKTPVTILKKQGFFSDFTLPEASESIWQPPKIIA